MLSFPASRTLACPVLLRVSSLPLLAAYPPRGRQPVRVVLTPLTALGKLDAHRPISPTSVCTVYLPTYTRSAVNTTYKFPSVPLHTSLLSYTSNASQSLPNREVCVPQTAKIPRVPHLLLIIILLVTSLNPQAGFLHVDNFCSGSVTSCYHTKALK